MDRKENVWKKKKRVCDQGRSVIKNGWLSEVESRAIKGRK